MLIKCLSQFVWNRGTEFLSIATFSFDVIGLRDDRGANIIFLVRVFVLLTRISYYDKLTRQIWRRLNATSWSQTINWIKIEQMTGFVEHCEEGRTENMLRLIFEIIQFYYWTKASRQKNERYKSLLNSELYLPLQILSYVITAVEATAFEAKMVRSVKCQHKTKPFVAATLRWISFLSCAHFVRTPQAAPNIK